VRPPRRIRIDETSVAEHGGDEEERPDDAGGVALERMEQEDPAKGSRLAYGPLPVRRAVERISDSTL
jgi:hypothetical protein